MKVNDLRSELDARNMSTKGLKSQLIARLSKALKVELEREEKQEVDTTEIEEQCEEIYKKEIEEIEDERKKEDDAKKQNEKKDQIALEEFYRLPDVPSIIIHPSRTAKNGKFDCTVMSLSVLLDYRQADNKEHSFEVSLFAELFNEMLMRDFGFIIYYKLAEMPEQKNEKEETRKKKDEADYGSDHEEETDDEEDKEKRKKKHKKKQTYTVDPSLLLACVYFDQTYCGYILEKDLEELLYMIGLKLSRAQVRKVLQKVCKREMFHYRKITDKMQNESAHNIQHPKDDVISANIKKISMENQKYFPIFKTKSSEQNKSFKEECLTNGSTDKEKDDSPSIVFYQGTVVDIQKLVQQLVKRERACADAELRLKELELQLKDMQEKVKTSENQSNKANSDLIEQQQKLKTTEEELKKVQSQSEKYRKTLSNCQDQLHSLYSSVQSVLRRSSSRSSSHNVETKNENSNSQLKEEVKGDN